MGDLRRDLQIECQLVSLTLSHLRQARAREEMTFVELAAVAAFMFNVYNGIENMLKRIFKHYGFALPESDAWHCDLLFAAHEHNIISHDLLQVLDEYRAFRHFFVHSYGVTLDARKMLPLAEKVEDVWRRFMEEVSLYLGISLSPENGNNNISVEATDE